MVSKIKLRELNTCITEKINSLNQEDILCPNITLNDIKTKGYLRVSSRPPIREQVFSLIKRIRMDNPRKNVKDLINKVYYIRNMLFHANYYLEDILESFRDNFSCINFNIDDFVVIIKEYELFFESLILKYFKIIPNYFDYKLSERWKHFHFLEWKKIKLPSYLLKEEIRKNKLNERLKEIYENRKDYELNSFLYDKDELLSKGKYTSLMKFISRFNQRIKNYTQNTFFIGYTNTRTGFGEVQIKFKDNLNGIFNIQNLEKFTHFTNGYIIEESPVFSKMIINSSTYGLSFDFSAIITFPIDIGAEHEQINGEFKTMIRDIQKL